MIDYPTFRNPELSSMVGQLSSLDSRIRDGHKILEDLSSERKATDGELRNQTHEWYVSYELRVMCEGRSEQFESWLADWEIVSPKVHQRGEYVETEEEARQRVADAKEEIANLRGQKVTIKAYPSTEEGEGIVTDYNIYRVSITKGRFDFQNERNRILYEETPDHQPKGIDWD